MKRKGLNLKHNSILIVAALMVTVFLIGFVLNHPMYILDCIFAYLVIGIFFFVEKRYPLKSWLIILGTIPFILELTGLTFGFFTFSVFGFGFDKMLHFVNSAILTILFYFWISTDYKQHKGIKIVVAIFVIMGIGSMGEVFEFLGQRYFHIYGSGVFSQGDLLPSTLQNDLKNYDTWWDMVLNFFGALFAGIILVIKKK